MGKKLKFKNNREIGNYNRMLLDEFRKLHLDESCMIPLKDIGLSEEVHLKTKKDMAFAVDDYKRNGKTVTSTLIVRKDGNDYKLVCGWRGYMIAKGIGQEEISAIVVEDESRTGLKKRIGCRAPFAYIPTEKIHLSPDQLNITVNQNKLEAVRIYAEKYNNQLKPILVDENMNVIDGYTQYIYNVNNDIEKSEVIMIHRKNK